MDRRNFLAAGAAGAAGAAAMMLPSSGAMAKPKQSKGGGSGGVARDLKGDYLDLTTARGNREASARYNGNIDMKSTKYGWFKGIVHGVRPGEAVRDLVGFTGFSCARLLPTDEGSDPGYKKVLREIGFYTDLVTGEILEEWTNPYLDEKVRVVPIANDPFNHTITDYQYMPPSYGGLNKDKPPKIPLKKAWERRDNQLLLAERINLFYPAALQPDKWPREATASGFNQVTEQFLYQLNWDEMQNPEITGLSARGTWTRTTPWLPWMLMGPSEGHCMYSCFFGSENIIDYADQKALDYAAKHYPKFLEAPEIWEEPSLSSLEWYAREQKPAPLPVDGKVPFAPVPTPSFKR